METNRLLQFCTIVETGSFTKASELLGISHSGLSKSMKILELELGIQLFLPEGRGIVVTDKGNVFYPRARKLLLEVERLLGQEEPSISEIRIGALEVFCNRFLGLLLAKEFSSAKAEVSQLGQGEIERALLNQKIDYGITYFPIPQQGIEYLKIKTIDLQIYVRKKSNWETFTPDLPFVLPLTLDSPDITDFKDQDGWPDHKLHRKASMKTNQLSTALNYAVEEDVGIFIPDFVADLYNSPLKSEYHLKPIKNLPSFGRVRRDIYIVKRINSPEDGVMKKIAKGIRTLC